MGDPCGIGPEIIVKALGDAHIYEICSPLVIGDLKILNRAKQIVESSVQFKSVTSSEDGAFQLGTIDCLDMDLLPANLPFGRVLAKAGDAAYRFVERATTLAIDRKIHAICTAPLSKEALCLGGHCYPGHTEILAELCGVEEYAMMFSSPKLNVILVTTHVGLVESVNLVTTERVIHVIQLGAHAMQQLGGGKPKIAVCGINPHAGESGMFGRKEEEMRIIPAIEHMKEKGLNISGPLPADTVFYRALRGDFDLVVAMYHDQGLIPIKTIGMKTAVNITVGLPIIRTSVDHGTAFDIAGRGIADETNLKYALRKAAQMAGSKNA